jgi:hypothetical protein
MLWLILKALLFPSGGDDRVTILITDDTTRAELEEAMAKHRRHPPPHANTLGRQASQAAREARRTARGLAASEGLSDDLTAWSCGYCGRRWVVPGLARGCEAKHERDET